jgi:phage shock protein C
VNPRRLYRSRINRAVAGIAGGMAEYLEVDPTIVRILWILAAIFTGGLVLLLYIILAFVIPMNPFQGGPIPAAAAYGAGGTTGWGQPPTAPGGAAPASGASSAAWSPDWNARYEAERAARAERPGRAGLIIGTVLIVFGAIALAGVVLPGWISGALFAPALLLAIGAALLVVSLGRRDGQVPSGAAGYAAPTFSAPAAGAAQATSAAAATEAPAATAPTPDAAAVGVSPADDADATAPVPDLAEPDRR